MNAINLPDSVADLYFKAAKPDLQTLLYTTTFGTISALFGLQNHIIDERQYSVLVTIVILSAFIPTLLAQRFFEPRLRTMAAWGRLYHRRIHGVSREDPLSKQVSHVPEDPGRV